ncbi:hypothetical protein I6G82_06060 [Lysinibacillus macroides]|uniref:Peptidase M10 metallopeptidase domain-containing protein n=1 Tax=Lysinibacillus macroides TaxID=33935 RepID=A0A0M9DMC2_9BACI|nr:hypothetical protein [Lysinibacillus macroides]KOY83310.1 hypothetical protein ADM90_08550 [Lysinibacillus macroides]QPR69176.1 hypothetical protein I6G82_06060 [Lysinibacillus macroides]
MRKKRISINLFIIALLLLMSSVVSADTWFMHRSNKFNSILTAYYDSSVATYGYTSAYDDARARWGGISSDVSISKTTSTNNNPDKYYIGTTASPTLIGRMIPYTKTSTGFITEASVDDDWLYATVRMYYNNMNSFGMNYSQIVSNAVHEIGHSLKLAHPGQGTESSTPVPSGQYSVMNQGIQSIGPQSYDKNELIKKWGY